MNSILCNVAPFSRHLAPYMGVCEVGGHKHLVALQYVMSNVAVLVVPCTCGAYRRASVTTEDNLNASITSS